MTQPQPMAAEDDGTMDLTAERCEGVLSLEVKGRIDGSNAAAFEEAMRSAIGDTDRAVIVVLRELAYVSSAGLRAILTAAKFVKAQGVGLALCSLSEQVLEVFRIGGFDKIVPVYDAPADARAALGV